MSYLLYCIFQGPARRKQKSLLGVERQPVFVTKRDGLSVAVSKIAAPNPPPDIAGLLAYEKVIESFYRQGAVIPLRYGSVFEHKEQIPQFLKEGSQRFPELLRELEGKVEMAIQVLLPNSDRELPCVPQTGAAYLVAQRQRYGRADQVTAELEAISRQIQKDLAGLFVRSHTEISFLPGRCLLSLYFLVPRQSVKRFRKAFQRMGQCSSPEILLTEPWPPHNFVC